MSNRSLYDYYNSLFTGIIANTEMLIEECYQLRHQVYCIEKQYEITHTAAKEYDKHDRFSGHAMLLHRPSKSHIGTVRLILPHPQASEFPVYQLMRQHDLALPPHYTIETTAEISRFAISKNFRRRVTDTLYPAVHSEEELAMGKRYFIPCMALGLMMTVNKMAQWHGIDKYCAVMDPSLIRLLSRLGIHFHPIGPLIEYHGVRQICCVTLDEMRESVPRERPDILDVLTDRGRYS